METNTIKLNKATKTVSCNNCKCIVNRKDCIICYTCKKAYEFNCAGVSEKLYRLMDPERRRTWKCRTCTTAKEGRTGRKEIMGSEQDNINVTHRKKRKVLKNDDYQDTEVQAPLIPPTSPLPNDYLLNTSTDSVSLTGDTIKDNHLSPETLSRSLELKPDYGSQIQELEEEIVEICSNLESTQMELENTILENNDLKREINKMAKEIQTLKNICKSPKPAAGSNATKNKRHSVQDSNDILSWVTPLRNSVLLQQSRPKPSKEIKELELKVTLLEEELRNANKEISGLKQQIISILQDRQEKTKENTPLKNQDTGKYDGEKDQPKLCIISTDKNKDVISNAEYHFQGASINHYLLSGCDINYLLKDLSNKLEGFTLNDYCIILIGELDFKITNGYPGIIECLRNKLLTVQHTNIIICQPTYKCGKYVNLFNNRIEIFNNLLYMDNLTYEYAYIVDSNKNLEYTPEMFDRNNGSVNEKGFRVIFNDISELARQIKTEHKINSTPKINLEMESTDGNDTYLTFDEHKSNKIRPTSNITQTKNYVQTKLTEFYNPKCICSKDYNRNFTSDDNDLRKSTNLFR